MGREKLTNSRIEIWGQAVQAQEAQVLLVGVHQALQAQDSSVAFAILLPELFVLLLVVSRLLWGSIWPTWACWASRSTRPSMSFPGSRRRRLLFVTRNDLEMFLY
ncbi:hypothetical protein Ahy_A06g027458 isoform C [Arachis hypogaea]|uniref:Uncharacterized protein n=1 Tax=Arachis hypogaea TaxID=3818 RepID=A0A445CNQ4_ARAHY|nr:hypothetical protein Ahy_A06g027458 isoform C [Arachis hypogaea]